MDDYPVGCDAIVVVSVWSEAPVFGGLRARITTEVGGSPRQRFVTAAAGIDEICLALRESIEHVAAVQ